MLALMDEVARDPGAWVNLEPAMDPEADPPPSSSLFGIFSAVGPAVPVCTWVPGKRRGERTEPMSLGVEHGSGPRAVARLEARGVTVPAGWRVRQDHPRRGLVLEAPADQDHDSVLDWLLRAGPALSVVPLTGTWLAAVFRSS